MFGRHPKLPVDLIFGLQTTNQPCEYSEYVQTLHDCLLQAYAQANQTSQQAKGQQKKYYDQGAKSQVFNPGDRVLVEVFHVEGRQKLGDKWEPRPYIVVKKKTSIPVYVVRSENVDTERVVHRNPLTQCMFLPVEQTGEVIIQGDESDTVEDLEVDNTEENVEKCLPETTEEQFEHTGMEEVDVEAEQMSEGGEEHVTARGTILPPSPSVPRRNSPRNQRPPKKLS